MLFFELSWIQTSRSQNVTFGGGNKKADNATTLIRRLPSLVWGTSAMVHAETAVIGCDVKLRPEERLHAHKPALGYSHSQLVVTCTTNGHNKTYSKTHTNFARKQFPSQIFPWKSLTFDQLPDFFLTAVRFSGISSFSGKHSSCTLRKVPVFLYL